MTYCQYLEDLPNTVNHCFPENHAWVKDPFKAHERPLDFNITEYKKFIDMVAAHSTWQQAFEKPSVKFRYNIKEYPNFFEKAVDLPFNYLSA